jgi:hypothetical protein
MGKWTFKNELFKKTGIIYMALISLFSLKNTVLSCNIPMVWGLLKSESGPPRMVEVIAPETVYVSRQFL